MRSPRVADIIAGTLRQRILSGQLTDGESLPRQEDLIEQFNAGLPAVRESLRILELEGLISVRRGNMGGAAVHLPTLNQAAYMSAVVMQSREARLKDVADSLNQLEPVCAQMCAERADREQTVVPHLDEAVETLQHNINSEPAVFNERSHDFHRALIEGCGNEAMRVSVGSLMVIWAAHERAYTERARQEGTFPGLKGRRESCEAHERILDAIRKGDGKLAARRTAAHSSAVHAHHFAFDDHEFVNATTLQTFYLPS
jgi:GntR family transcriptional regulator, transcriptional repressor for pyruvate dehydrogenase complex